MSLLLNEKEVTKLLKLCADLAFESHPTDFFKRLTHGIKPLIEFEMFNGVICRGEEILQMDFNIPDKIMEDYVQVIDQDIFQSRFQDKLTDEVEVETESVVTWKEILNGEPFEKFPISDLFFRGDLHQGLVACQYKGKNLLGYLSLSRGKTQPEFSPKEKQVIQLISPVLKKGIQKFFESHDLTLLKDLLDQENIGVLFISPQNKKIISENGPAEKFFIQHPQLKNFLIAKIEEMETKLLDRAFNGENPRFLIPTLEGYLSVKFADIINPLGLKRNYRVVLEMINLEKMNELLMDTFLNSYPFTPMERKMLIVLNRFTTIRQIGEHFCISPLTVKVHIKKILNKTGTENQKELLQKIFGRT